MRTIVSMVLILLLSSIIYAQNPAILELESTTQGFLPPVMTKEQMKAIPSPVEGWTVYCKDCRNIGPYFFNGAYWIGLDNKPYDLSISDVYNPGTGKVWMDRNLGASQVATSSTDALAYGGLFQWGRGPDGHEIRTSDTTTSLANNDTPGHEKFILTPDSPNDWRKPENVMLWQGVNGVNNPFPSGYRLPSDAELDAERTSWGSNDPTGAFASSLKLPMAGFRSNSSGLIHNVGSFGGYWSSTVSGSNSRLLLFSSSVAVMSISSRGSGRSLRCLKD